ncbi:MAG: transcription elongation factor [Polyangiaceae bacterium]
MPERETLRRSRRKRDQGDAPSTQAGEFVREEIRHVRRRKHGARSPEQVIAIGLSKARRAGVELPPPKPGKASAKTRARAERDYERGHRKGRARTSSSPRRTRATRAALAREGSRSASREALSAHGRRAAKARRPQERSAAARKAARTKGPARRTSAAKKAARTRAAKS